MKVERTRHVLPGDNLRRDDERDAEAIGRDLLRNGFIKITQSGRTRLLSLDVGKPDITLPDDDDNPGFIFWQR